MHFVHQPSPSGRLGDFLKDNLCGEWTHFRAAVAFVKRSGVRHVAPGLAEFARTGHVEIIAGIDHQGTSFEGLNDLLGAVSPRGRIIIFHNRLPFTFHPKIYLFKSPAAADVLIGSGNLTEGGLFTNYEAGLRVLLDLGDSRQAAFLQSMEQVLDTWADLSSGTAYVLDDTLLARLASLDLVPSETVNGSGSGGVEQGANKTRLGHSGSPFAARAEPRAPVIPPPVTDPVASSNEVRVASATAGTPQPHVSGVTGFVMTLQRTDVSVGQVTARASQRSPEVFIPLVARDAEPEFWGWPDAFVRSSRPPHPLSRTNVRMRLLDEVISVTIMTWPPKRDFRLRSSALRRAGNVGDVLRIEKVESPTDYEYDVEVIAEGTSRHSEILALCRHAVRNSQKRYGYY